MAVLVWNRIPKTYYTESVLNEKKNMPWKTRQTLVQNLCSRIDILNFGYRSHKMKKNGIEIEWVQILKGIDKKMQVSLCPKKLYIWNTIYAGGKRRDRQYHGIGEYPISLALSLNIFFHYIFASTASLSTYILACFLASTLKISTAPRELILNIIVELEKRETRTSAKHSLNIDVKVLLTAKLCSRKSIKFNKVRILKSWLVGWLVGWSFLE